MLNRRHRNKRPCDEFAIYNGCAKRNRMDQEVPKRDASGSSSDSNSSAGPSSTRQHVPETLGNIPRYGTPVERNRVRKAGPFVIGHELGTSPGVPQTQYLGRREGTSNFYLLKILSYDTDSEVFNKETQQGKTLLHTEYTLLSLVADLDGVIHHHGLFCDYALEEKQVENADRTVQSIYTGRVKKRLILVLDCVHAHEFNEHSVAFVNLQKYVQMHKFTEIEALTIFYEIVKVVEELHRRNIIHRDLKLNNIVLNKRTNKVVIVNFFLAKHLNNENDYLYDQRGSPAYISPDVLCGKPYKGKPSDVWALGVILYTIIYGKFPFLDNTPSALFKKIRQVDYHIPAESKISQPTVQLVKSMLKLNPAERYTAAEVRTALEGSIANLRGPRVDTDQIVPDVDDLEQPSKEPSPKVARTSIDSKTVSFPSFELSNEAFSKILEGGTQRRDSESFLRPRSLVNRGVKNNLRFLRTFNTLQNRMIVYGNNLYTSGNSPVRVRTGDSNGSNGAFVIRTPINRAEARHEPAPMNGASGENIHSGNVPNAAHQNILQQHSGQPISQPQHIASNIFVSVDPPSLVNLATASTITLPMLSAPAPTITVAPAFQDPDVHYLYQSMNNLFARRLMPGLAREEAAHFTGVVTQEMANKLAAWLVTNLNNHAIVQEVFSNSTNRVQSVLELLRRAGVQMDTRGANPVVKVDQTFDVLMFLTYLLQVAGYNNNYFIITP